MFRSILGFSLVILTIAASASAGDLDWPAIQRTNKPWTRWWWLGSAVDEKNLSREMELIQGAGIGGVEITPLYGATGYESRDIPFLSPKWVQMVGHVGAEGKRLDLGVDMATGTGWPFGGGPLITPEFADTMVALEDGKLVPKPTGMKVKRAAPGDEGWVLDPYSVKAIEKYLGWFNEPMSALPKGLVRAQFHDSFEYMGNWTADFQSRFISWKGYDLAEHAKELFGQGDPDTVGRVKSDYREVLANLHEEYHDYWVKWCHEHGWVAREQAHGAPDNLLDLYGAADIPETETFGSTPFTIPGFRRDASEIASNGNGPNTIVTRFATSAAHVMGRPLASCETLTWLREHFHVALSMAKPEVDQMFLSGINHVFYHGMCYSPDDAPWPGWLFYASTEVNPRETLWKTMPQLNQYIARCQSILQGGLPDNDVLVYFPFFDHIGKPEGMEIFFKVNIAPPWLVGSEIEKTCQQLTSSGFSYDMISDKQILQASNSGSRLHVPGGNYRVLLVPKTMKMPVETLRKLIALAEGGATIVFADSIPQDVPGLANLSARRAEAEQLRARLGSSPTPANGTREITIGNGRIIVGWAIADALVRGGATRESLGGERVELIRRKTEQGHDYFIASLGTRSLDGWTSLAVDSESVVMLDPLTGKSGVAASRKVGNVTEVCLQLQPGQSIILRTLDHAVQGPAWQYLQTAGAPVELAGTWQVDFISGGPDFPKSFATSKLESWTTLGDEDANRFAGTARYRIRFDRPAGIDGPCRLDLGDVREAAKVTLNGEELGTAWSLPFVLDVKELRDRGNILEIEVTNLTANRIRDLDIRGAKWRIFKEINYVNINYTPFDASKWPLAPSGLVSAVHLVPVKQVSPN